MIKFMLIFFVQITFANNLCRNLSDHFCQKLNDDQHLGNLKTFDGHIWFGYAEKSDLLLTIKMDHELLLKKVKHKKLMSALSLLKKHYDSENSSDKWHAKLTEIDSVIQKEITNNQLGNEIVKLKYGDHPNWINGQKLFVKAKDYVMKIVSEFKINEVEKKSYLDKISKINLTLPINKNYGCQTTEDNAYYFPDLNEITICAGMINNLQSSSALIMILMHEISHSIDPVSLSYEANLKNNSFDFDFSNETCESYKSKLGKLKKELGRSFVAEYTGLKKVYECLQSNLTFMDYNFDELKLLSKISAKEIVSDEARQHLFSKEKNETKNDDLIMFKFLNKCQPHYEKALNDLIEFKTFEILSGLKVNTTFLPLLEKAGMSKNIQEYFADWLGGKAFILYLKTIPHQQQREASTLAVVRRCDVPDDQKNDPVIDKKIVDRFYSDIAHGEDEQRMLSFYSKEMGEILSCIADPTGLQFSECSL